MRRILGCITVFLLCISLHSFDSIAQEAAAQEAAARDALSIVPASASAAIAVRDVAELIKRGDEFIDKTGIRVPMRFSQGFQVLTTILGLQNGVDRGGAFALMALASEPDLEDLVLTIPVKDWDAMASNFGIKRGALVPGKVIDLNDFPKRRANNYVRFVAVRGDDLILGMKPEYVREAAYGKPLRDTIENELRETLAKDDIFVFLGREIANPLLEDPSRYLGDVTREVDDREEAELLKRLAEASVDFSRLMVGIRLDQGVGGTVVLDFDGDRSRALLSEFVDDRFTSSLTGLPDGKILAAQAFSGQRDEMVVLVRLVANLLLDGAALGPEIKAWPGERSSLVELFGLGWQRCRETRIALYENDDPAENGWFSLLAILDTDDADAFLEEIVSVMPFVEAAGMPGDQVPQVIDDELIDQLVADLGSKRFRVRQLASLKLSLLGAKGLPALNAARDSDDAEVRARVQYIMDRINRVAASERKKLLEQDLMRRLNPKFEYAPRQEEIAGQTVDWFAIKLRGGTRSSEPQLRRLMGPQWNRLRVTKIGNRVILFAGSNPSILETALIEGQKENGTDVQTNRLGQFIDRAAKRRNGELHLSLSRLRDLVDGAVDPKDSQPPVGLTSSDLWIQPQQVRFDLFAPFEDVRSVAEQMGW